MFLLLGILAARPALAQEARATIAGTVVDSVTGKSLRGAVAYFTSGTKQSETDRNGTFKLERRTALDTVVVVRAIGYLPVYIRIPLSSAAATVDVGTIGVRPVATRLEEIAVETEEVRRFPRAEEFYQRKQQGIAGEFITRDDIQKTAARQISAVVSRSAKVSMDCGRETVKTGSEECMAKDRRGMRASYSVFGSGAACEKQLWVDGMRSRLGIDEIPLDDIAAIEIYAGPATTPAKFGAPPCGVVALWTVAGAK